MFMIGIDPHKGSHTAVAVDGSEAVIDTIRVDADRHQRARLLAWAARFEPRTWAIEGASGMGAMLAQQLVGAGEHVVDVPPKLSSPGGRNLSPATTMEFVPSTSGSMMHSSDGTQSTIHPVITEARKCPSPAVLSATAPASRAASQAASI